MSQVIKTKKIDKRAKKIKSGRNDKKTLNPFLKKKRPDTAKEIMGGGKHPARKDIEAGLGKIRKELAAIKKTADLVSEFAESIIDTVREPLIVLDHDLRVVKVNRSFYDFFKVKPTDTVGKLIYDLGNKQWDIPKLRELLETILPQKTSFDNYEVDHEFATIGRRVMLLNARQIQQGAGKERIILLAIEDITERKRLESLLMESEELYKGVFKTASDGIVLLEKREGKITHANPAAEKMLGYSIKECIGNKLQDIGFMLDLGDFQTTMRNLNRNGIINHKDVPVKTKSGQHINTDIYLVDKTKAVQCNIRDITDRTRTEEALSNSEKNFRRSLDDSPLGVRIVTTKGKTIYANRTILDFYGFDGMDEINSIPIKERYTPQSYAEFQIRKKDRERGDSGLSEYEINIVRKNGEIRHLLVLRKEILWDGTKQFQVIYQDITERKQAEEKIRNSLAEKNVLLKEVHHRVKNNLMIIIGLIKMEETKTDNEMFNHLLQELERRIRSMAQVHEGFYKSTDLAHIDLQNYIETMGAQISAQFGADRNIRFSVQAVGVKLGLDIAVPCGLILNELITNAYKHAFPGDKPRSGENNCEIKVIVEQEGGVLILTVANNGVGLPADLDVEKSETLGLRLIKMLTQQINGSIELDRSAGTAYRLKFSMAV